MADAIAAFLARYVREYDYYQHVASLAGQQMEAALQAAGIRGIVTARAKNPGRLEAKCRQRVSKKEYSDVDAIAADIVDLAGMRVALYFPGDREKVEAIVNRLFVQVRPPKTFPEPPRDAQYKKRFAGYFATHYLVSLRDGGRDDVDGRYQAARIEVQVASVLMHAWAEVEHDLVYKPLAGELSEDENVTLDEVNGLVLAGELALERLQRALERRVGAEKRTFDNHFDLTAFIAAEAPKHRELRESDLGRVDVLYDFLVRVGVTTPEALRRYISDLDADFERRPIADQITDQLLAEDESRYGQYEAARESAHLKLLPPTVSPDDSDLQTFLHEYVAVERLLKQLAEKFGLRLRTIGAALNWLRQRGLVPQEVTDDLEQLRRLRNTLVHGVEPINTADLANASRRLRDAQAILQKELLQ